MSDTWTTKHWPTPEERAAWARGEGLEPGTRPTTTSGVEPRSGKTPPGAGADLLETAWGVIANVSGGDWTRQSAEWQRAAERWRDQWHATLRNPTPPGAGADLLARLLECVGRYGMDCAETKQLAPRYELTEAANAIATELRRLADIAERIRALPLPTPDLDAIREAARAEGRAEQRC